MRKWTSPGADLHAEPKAGSGLGRCRGASVSDCPDPHPVPLADGNTRPHGMVDSGLPERCAR